MVDIRIKLRPEIIRHLRESMGAFAKGGGFEDHVNRSALVPGTDTEMEEVWRQALQEQLQEDMKWLLTLFSKWEQGTEVQRIEVAEAEGISRACSAARIRIREFALSGLPDEALESGEFELEPLSEPERHALQCYIVLAGIQAHVVESLDPGCAEES